MLETLDQIDWKAIGYHVYGRNETIPENIQRLASSDPEVRVNAVDFLLGVGQDFGDLYDTTPHILPFLFELLSQEAALDSVDLLDHMAQVAKYMYDGRCRSIYMMRLGLKTYDALRAGQGVLIKMLGHSPSEVRIASAKLLQYMTDDVETLVPLIIDSFYKEPDEDVRIALLVSLKTLFSSLAWTHYRWSDQYVSFFAEVIDASPSHKVTVAAASAIVELMDRGRDKREELSEKVSAILVRDFWKRPCPMSVEERDSPYRK